MHSGFFLDAATLVGALNEGTMSLEDACKLYDTATKKTAVESHGIMTPEYIEYNLDDVQSTWELYKGLMVDYDALGITLPAYKAYSPAAIGKAHFADMGIRPLLDKQPDFPLAVHGYAMEAYYGGRVEGHWPNAVHRVSYLDVLSMYPTVYVLQRLWWLVVAARLHAEDFTSEAQHLLGDITLEDLFQQHVWHNIPALVLLQPQDDLLPVRADYSNDGSQQIGLNYLRSTEPRWYTLADAIVSKLHTKRVPRVLRAIRLSPSGVQTGLKPFAVRGVTTINPAEQDFFLELVNQRLAIKSKPQPLSAQDKALQLFIKVLLNATSYGINTEFNEQRLSQQEPIEVFTGDRFTAISEYFEKPGKYCNPYIGTCITGAARLILTMVQLSGQELGTSYTMCDTDSMAVIDPEGKYGGQLTERFSSLFPYAGRGSILKREDENFDPTTGKPKPLYCYVKAAKKYVLFNMDERTGRPIIRKALEHGLGHLLAPFGESRKSWIEKFWYVMVCEHLGIPCDEPSWFNEIAMAQMTISTTHLIRSFHGSKTERSERGAWPFNFMLVGYANEPASPKGYCKKHNEQSIGCRDASPCRHRASCPLMQPIRPIAKYAKNVRHPEQLEWIDAHTGDAIIVDPPNAPTGEVGHVTLKTFEDIDSEFTYHIDAKAAGADGLPAQSGYAGELQPLHVVEINRKYTGKEARNLDVSEAFGNSNEQYLAYDRGWPELREALRPFGASQVSKVSGMARSQVHKLLNGMAQPERKTLRLLSETLAVLMRNSEQSI